MRYPRLKINLSKVENNCKIINDRCTSRGISVVGVSKCFLGDPEIAYILKKQGIKIFGDSRLLNLRRLRDHFGPGQELYMLRTPMVSEVRELVHICNTSMNTQKRTVKAISDECVASGLMHRIIIMVETDDRREGLLPDEFEGFCNYIINNCPGIRIWGIGTNARCLSDKKPLPMSLELLLALKMKTEKNFGIDIPVISGGNSSIWNLIEKNLLPEGINQVRIGEAILLGHETSEYVRIKGTHDDAFILEAEIIEAGPISCINNESERCDDKMAHKVIAALGLQDVNFKNIKPFDPSIKIIGQSSDHTVLAAAEMFKTGDILSFSLNYFGLLACMSSPFVEKIYIKN